MITGRAFPVLGKARAAVVLFQGDALVLPGQLDLKVQKSMSIHAGLIKDGVIQCS